MRACICACMQHARFTTAMHGVHHNGHGFTHTHMYTAHAHLHTARAHLVHCTCTMHVGRSQHYRRASPYNGGTSTYCLCRSTRHGCGCTHHPDRCPPCRLSACLRRCGRGRSWWWPLPPYGSCGQRSWRRGSTSRRPSCRRASCHAVDPCAYRWCCSPWVHTVAARGACGCSLGCTQLQPGLHTVAGHQPRH